MSKAICIFIAILILTSASVSLVSAAGQLTVVKKEVIDSQYGFVGDLLGVGNRLYRITYSDGTTSEVMMLGSSLLKGAITEQPSGTTIWSSVCYNAKIDYRIKTVQDSTNSFTDTHKIEVWENDLGASVNLLKQEFPGYKVYDSNSFSSSSTISTPYTVQVPYRGYAADQKMPMMVVEYQQKKDGTWVMLADPGYGKTSTFMIGVIWSSKYQSGSGVGSLSGGSCRYTAPQPSAPITPTPAPVTTKTIRVLSDPAGAEVTSSGASLGTTPFDLSTDSSSAKILTFTKFGYTTVAKGVDINTVSPVTVTLKSSTIPVTTTPTPTTPVPTTPATTTSPSTAPDQAVPTSTSGTGGMTLETEPPASGGGSSTITYEEESLLNSTNILIALVIGVIAVVGYTKLYVQKGKRKGKGR